MVSHSDFVDVGKGFRDGATIPVSYEHKTQVPYLGAVQPVSGWYTVPGTNRIWTQ